MAVGTVARLADELGVAASRARKYVDEMGDDVAARVAKDAARAGDEGISNWTKAGVGAGAIGGGALYWREQDVRTARALADQQQSFNDAIKHVMESDLPGDVKRELVLEAGDAATGGGDGDGGGGGSGGGGDGGGGGLIPQDPQTLIVLVIVMALVLKFALDGGDE